MCDEFNPWHCGPRFGGKPEERLDKCRQILSASHRWTETDSEDTNNATIIGERNKTKTIEEQYEKYGKCLVNIRKQVK